MRPDIFQKALLATARVACCAALFSCNQHSEPKKTTDTPTTPTPAPVTQASSVKAPESVPVSAPASASAPSTEPSLASCQSHVKAVFTDKTTPPNALTGECCQKVANNVGIATSEWQERDECCKLLGWKGSIACTPWGPPTPPAMVS